MNDPIRLLFARYRLTDSFADLKGEDHAGVDWKIYYLGGANFWLLARRTQPAVFPR